MLEVIENALTEFENSEYEHFKQEWKRLKKFYYQREIKVLVLGPFNQGKSTLLNAILGGKHLPFDLVPTTSIPIEIRYGEKFQTKITMKDGQKIVESGCNLLHHFAVLDERRQINSTVKKVEVFCPHPFLKGDVVLVDLPGTDALTEHNEMVESELFSADIVVQMLSARKPFTLEERNCLDCWVFGRGITQICFVVNFCNLLETDEQSKSFQYLQNLIENYLPVKAPIYRVDALPALRSQLKSNQQELYNSGLLHFLDDLRTQIQRNLQNKQNYRHYRLRKFAGKLLPHLQEKQNSLNNQLAGKNKENKLKAEKENQEIQSSKNDFLRIWESLRRKFSPENLYTEQFQKLSWAIQENKFGEWQTRFYSTFAEKEFIALNQKIAEISRIKNAAPFRVSYSFPPLNSPHQSMVQKSADNKTDPAIIIGIVVGAIIGTMVLPIFGTVCGVVIGFVIGAAFSSPQPSAPVTNQAGALQSEKISQEYLNSFSQSVLYELQNIKYHCEPLFTPIKQQPQISAAEQGLLAKIRTIEEKIIQIKKIAGK